MKIDREFQEILFETKMISAKQEKKVDEYDVKYS